MEHADFDQNAEGTAQRVVTGLSKLGLAMKNNAWHVSAGRGLSATQAQVLALLYASREPMRLRAIASQLAVTEGTASASVAALEAKQGEYKAS